MNRSCPHESGSPAQLRLFDAHTHLDMPQFRNDLDDLMARAKNAGIVGMVSSSIGADSFSTTMQLVDRYKGFVFQSAGCSVSQLTPEEAERIIGLIRAHSDRIVAVGEVGLDYYWVKDEPGRRSQEPLFISFLELASDLGKPVVVHSRRAEKRAIDLLECSSVKMVLMHCFDGSRTDAARVHDNGWYITVPATFAKSSNRVAAVQILPIDQIMLETDGPYMSPVGGRNEPCNIVYGCRSLAEIKKIDPADVARVTTDNAMRFYGLL